MDRDTLTTVFSFFNEVGIINQLSRAILEENNGGDYPAEISPS